LKAELKTAHQVAEELLRFTQRLSNPALAVRGHWAMEATFTHLGEFARAIEHYDKALALYDPKQYLNDGYALHPAVAMPCFAAWALWFLGKTDQALDRIQEALKFARAVEQPLGLAHALLFAAILHQLRREPAAAIERATEAVDLSSQHGLVLYHAMATIMQGWVLNEYGRDADAFERINHGLAALKTISTELLRPHFLGLLAETLLRVGRYDEALEALREALALAERGGERCYEAELYRLKGEVLLKQAGWVRAPDARQNVVLRDVAAGAEECFNQSIKIATEQQARAWQLRTVMSLLRLHLGHNKQGQSVALLSEVYGTFTEGFSTADLREAEALLDQARQTKHAHE
jgi:predicted ATPase